MNNYLMHRSGGECDLSLTGANLVEAIESHFSSIAEYAQLGNPAGYHLERVWMEYDSSVLGGKGGVLLHILSRGSDSLLKYDPRTSSPKEAVVTISALPEDCPERYDFSLSEPSSYDPFADNLFSSFGQLFGTLSGIIDTLASSHCKDPYSSSPCLDITLQFPNLLSNSPDRFVSLVQDRLRRLRPVKSTESALLLSRIDFLISSAQAFSGDASVSDFSIFYYKTLSYFDRSSKTTALAYYRRKVGITQTELANKVGVSLRQIQRYENAQTSKLGNASYNFVCALASILRVKPSQLVEDGVTALISEGE